MGDDRASAGAGQETGEGRQGEHRYWVTGWVSRPASGDTLPDYIDEDAYGSLAEAWRAAADAAVSHALGWVVVTCQRRVGDDWIDAPIDVADANREVA